MIRTLNDTFYINPLPPRAIRHIKFSGGQLHVIYRRSIEELSSACHTSSKNSFVLLTVVSLSLTNVLAGQYGKVNNCICFYFFKNLEDGEHRFKLRERPKLHRRINRAAPHKFLEIALIADNFAIEAYGEDEMTFHLMAITHVVSLFSTVYPLFQLKGRLSRKHVTLTILNTNMEEYATFQ